MAQAFNELEGAFWGLTKAKDHAKASRSDEQLALALKQAEEVLNVLRAEERLRQAKATAERTSTVHLERMERLKKLSELQLRDIVRISGGSTDIYDVARAQNARAELKRRKAEKGSTERKRLESRGLCTAECDPFLAPLLPGLFCGRELPCEKHPERVESMARRIEEGEETDEVLKERGLLEDLDDDEFVRSGPLEDLEERAGYPGDGPPVTWMDEAAKERARMKIDAEGIDTPERQRELAESLGAKPTDQVAMNRATSEALKLSMSRMVARIAGRSPQPWEIKRMKAIKAELRARGELEEPTDARPTRKATTGLDDEVTFDGVDPEKDRAEIVKRTLVGYEPSPNPLLTNEARIAALERKLESPEERRAREWDEAGRPPFSPTPEVTLEEGGMCNLVELSPEELEARKRTLETGVIEMTSIQRPREEKDLDPDAFQESCQKALAADIMLSLSAEDPDEVLEEKKLLEVTGEAGRLKDIKSPCCNTWVHLSGHCGKCLKPALKGIHPRKPSLFDVEWLAFEAWWEKKIAPRPSVGMKVVAWGAWGDRAFAPGVSSPESLEKGKVARVGYEESCDNAPETLRWIDIPGGRFCRTSLDYRDGLSITMEFVSDQKTVVEISERVPLHVQTEKMLLDARRLLLVSEPSESRELRVKEIEKELKRREFGQGFDVGSKGDTERPSKPLYKIDDRVSLRSGRLKGTVTDVVPARNSQSWWRYKIAWDVGGMGQQTEHELRALEPTEGAAE